MFARLGRSSSGILFMAFLLTNQRSALDSHIKRHTICAISFYLRWSNWQNVFPSNRKLVMRRTKPCKVKRLAPDRVSIILTEGMNREIRRIFEIYDMGVSSLCRVRFLNITLDGMRPGESRRLTEDEIKKMKEGAFLKEGL